VKISERGARKKRRLSQAVTGKWPIEIWVDSVRILIYRTGKKHFTAAWRQGGARRRLARASLDAAKEAAEAMARDLTDGRAEMTEMRVGDRERFGVAVAAVKRTGIPIDVAAKEYAEAWELVQPASLLQVARWWREKHSKEIPSKRIPDLVEEFIKDRIETGLSERYVSTLRYRLGWFAGRFRAPVQAVTGRMIEDALARLRAKPKTWNNYRTDIVTLFNFARSRGYLPRDREVEATFVKRMKDPGKRIRVFTPGEMSRLLLAAAHGVKEGPGRPAIRPQPDLVPFIAIGGFAGIRPLEMQRLEWADIHWDRGVIEVAKHKAKTAARRLIPIQPNLAEWLAPHRAAGGRICNTKTSARVTALAKAIGLEWPHDVLRDSFISYRTAVTQNLSQVALEAGNSETIIRHSYLELRTTDEGKAWFAVRPEGSASNVLTLATAG